jgi:monofunctional biosynthetic peptidoglycan transglycosylase
MSFGKRTGDAPTKDAMNREETMRLRRRTGKPAGVIRKTIRFLVRAALWFALISVVWVLAYRFIDPPATYLTLRDELKGANVQQIWTDLEDMTPNIALAAVAAEDKNFCSHTGFDFDAIQQARKANARAKAKGGSKLRGASTISQQVAKNVFLWPQRSYLRKGLEAWFTVLIELLWPKRRIMEVYLNVAEWGPAVYGAEAAADHYFNKHADALTRTESARLVSILPSPLKWSPTAPSKRLKRKSRNVRRALGAVRSQYSDCLQE